MGERCISAQKKEIRCQIGVDTLPFGKYCLGMEERPFGTSEREIDTTPLVYTVAEVAEMLRRPYRTIQRLTASGEAPLPGAVKVGKRSWVYVKADVDKALGIRSRT